MKYLFINGSPHKGNTWTLAEKVKCFLTQLDKEADFKEIHLRELELPFCIGCSNCFRNGYEKCPHYEKISFVMKAIESSDGIIFISSTFNLRETALLKNLFDHFCFMLHRPHFFTSKAFIITTTGGVGAGSSAKSICATLKGIGFNRCYQYSTASFSWNNYIPTAKTIKRLETITNRFYCDIKSKRIHIQSTSVLIPYNLFRGMSLSYTKESEYPTADGDYWTQPSRKKKVYDQNVPIAFFQRPIGEFFYVIGKMAGKMKSMEVTYKK